MGVISSWFGAMYNNLPHESGNSPANKIEEWTIFASSHAPLYLSESDDEQDYKYAAAKTLYISYGGGGSSSSLSAINVSVLDTSNLVRCWMFISDLFLPNDSLTSDDIVDRDNDSTLGIGG